MEARPEDNNPARILLVDDEHPVLDALKRVLNNNSYEITTAKSGPDGLALLSSNPSHVIISDYRMPGMNGVEFLKEVCKKWPDTVRIILSGYADIQAVIDAVNDGQIYKFITKPWNNVELRITIANAVERYNLYSNNIRLMNDLKKKNEELQKFNETLEKLVADRTFELKESVDKIGTALEGTIQAIAITMETRDPYTAGHQKRAAELSCIIAEQLGLPSETIQGLRMAAAIHDIGKISIPAEILCKTSKLSEMEYSLVKLHAEVGYEMLKDIHFPWPVAKIIFQHHERINGSGYPLGLKDEAIIQEAKILAVADVVEAMLSFRPYRAALDIETTLDELRTNTAILYDTSVTDICIRLFEEKKFSFDAQ